MKRNIIVMIFGLFVLFSVGLGSAWAVSSESGGFNAVTYDDSISFSASLKADGSVLTTWSQYAHTEGFTYYKVVRSTTNSNPVYPEDGYIYYSGNIDELSYTDNDVPEGTVYYRICQIASPKRYCSRVVTLQGTVSAGATTQKQTQAQQGATVQNRFSDLATSHWAYGCVERLTDEGVVSGNPDGSFRPGNPINRAEFLKLIFIALYPDLAESSASACFTDVKAGDWFSGYVCAALNKKIVTGYTGNTFKPSQSITRAEAVSMLIKSLSLPISANPYSSFKDVTVAWQASYINSADKYGLASGYGDNTFRPNNNIARSEAAQLVCNALDADLPEEDLVDADSYATQPAAEIMPVTEVPELTDAIIVDHQSTDLSKIPASYLEDAKEMFRIAYGHTSHGSQLTTGMEDLKGAFGSTYYFSSDGTGGLYYNEGLLSGDLGSGGSTAWADSTRNMLANHSDINMVMWSWCGGMSGNSTEDVSAYLNAMNQLELDFQNVAFVYMTGHLDGTGVSGNLHQRNEQIRAYVRANNKVLFDFADIESYDPNGVYYLDDNATDGNDYDSGNWATNWCSANPGSELCDANSCAHSTSLNCNLKGRAFWWMLARLAGWEGN